MAIDGWLFALVSFDKLSRSTGRYADTPETAMLLDRVKAAYVGGTLQIVNAGLYPFWDCLAEFD